MAHHDHILSRFLEHQYSEAMALAANSDLLDLVAAGPRPSAVYLARFRCTGLVRIDRQIVEHDDFLVGIRFPDSYLRCFDTTQVLTWCEPRAIWHPNVRPPYVCAGRMAPGTTLVNLLYQLYEIITFHNVEMREPNALNHDACVWARRNVARFPLDRRPLRRPMPAPDPSRPPSSATVPPPKH